MAAAQLLGNVLADRQKIVTNGRIICVNRKGLPLCHNGEPITFSPLQFNRIMANDAFEIVSRPELKDRFPGCWAVMEITKKEASING